MQDAVEDDLADRGVRPAAAAVACCCPAVHCACSAVLAWELILQSSRSSHSAVERSDHVPPLQQIQDGALRTAGWAWLRTSSTISWMRCLQGTPIRCAQYLLPSAHSCITIRICIVCLAILVVEHIAHKFTNCASCRWRRCSASWRTMCGHKGSGRSTERSGDELATRLRQPAEAVGRPSCLQPQSALSQPAVCCKLPKCNHALSTTRRFCKSPHYLSVDVQITNVFSRYSTSLDAQSTPQNR